MVDLTPEMAEVLAFIVCTDVHTTLYHTELEQALADSEFYSELNDVYMDGKFVVSTSLSANSIGFFLHAEDGDTIRDLDRFVAHFFTSFEYEGVKPRYLGYKIEKAKVLTY